MLSLCIIYIFCFRCWNLLEFQRSAAGYTFQNRWFWHWWGEGIQGETGFIPRISWAAAETVWFWILNAYFSCPCFRLKYWKIRNSQINWQFCFLQQVLKSCVFFSRKFCVIQRKKNYRTFGYIFQKVLSSLFVRECIQTNEN